MLALDVTTTVDACTVILVDERTMCLDALFSDNFFNKTDACSRLDIYTRRLHRRLYLFLFSDTLQWELSIPCISSMLQTTQVFRP